MGWKAEQRAFRKKIEAGDEPTMSVVRFRRWAVQDPAAGRTVRQFMFRSSKEVDGWVESLGVYPPGDDVAPFAVIELAVHDAKQLDQTGDIVVISEPGNPMMLAVLSPDNDALWPLTPPRAAEEHDPHWSDQFE